VWNTCFTNQTTHFLTNQPIINRPTVERQANAF
jgi:hypothetical protein